MRVIKYGVELNEEGRPLIVAERSIDYGGEDVCGDPASVTALLCECFRLSDMAEEYAYVLGLTSKGKLLGVFELSHGTACGSPIGMRELMLRLILVGAASFVVVHNHPSGDVIPSDDDFETCEKIKRAADLMGFAFSDFIIVGKEIGGDGQSRYLSFFEEGILKAN